MRAYECKGSKSDLKKKNTRKIKVKYVSKINKKECVHGKERWVNIKWEGKWKLLPGPINSFLTP